MTKGCFPPFRVKVRDLLKEIPDILLTPLSSLQVLATILINFSNSYIHHQNANDYQWYFSRYPNNLFLAEIFFHYYNQKQIRLNTRIC